MSQGFVNNSGIIFPLAVSDGGTGQTASSGSGPVILQNQPTVNQANLVGTTTNDNAAAGSVGEEVSSVVSYPGAACTSVVIKNVTSIALTAGDWDVSGFVGGSGNGSTQVLYLYGQATTTSVSMDLSQAACSWGDNAAYFGLAPMTVTPRTTRFSLSTTTTIYLVYHVICLCSSRYVRRISNTTPG